MSEFRWSAGPFSDTVPNTDVATRLGEKCRQEMKTNKTMETGNAELETQITG